jgi:hypothetical protein
MLLLLCIPCREPQALTRLDPNNNRPIVLNGEERHYQVKVVVPLQTLSLRGSAANWGWPEAGS